MSHSLKYLETQVRKAQELVDWCQSRQLTFLGVRKPCYRCQEKLEKACKALEDFLTSPSVHASAHRKILASLLASRGDTLP